MEDLLYQGLSPVALKAFYFASDSLNFTYAAQRAHLTQSGVSQHIFLLEQELGVQLFLRVKKSLVLTEEGKELREYTKHFFEEQSALRASLQKNKVQLEGLVRYAMPGSCLMTGHFAALLLARKNFEKIRLKVQICSTREVADLVLKNEVDFGFVTQKVLDPDFINEPFAEEEYIMVSAKPDLAIDKQEALLEISFVKYNGFEELYQQWMRENFRTSKVEDYRLQHFGDINHLSAAILMVEMGVGVSIFPRHCVEDKLKKKKLFEVRLKKPQSVQKNKIFIAYLQDKKQSRAIESVLNCFRAMKT